MGSGSMSPTMCPCQCSCPMGGRGRPHLAGEASWAGKQFCPHPLHPALLPLLQGAWAEVWDWEGHLWVSPPPLPSGI